MGFQKDSVVDTEVNYCVTESFKSFDLYCSFHGFWFHYFQLISIIILLFLEGKKK